MREMSASVRGYRSVFLRSRRSSNSVMVRMWTTCRPLSLFRNSTMWLRMLIIVLLTFSFSYTCSATICTRRFCLA